jgi:hypothetical protein
MWTTTCRKSRTIHWLAGNPSTATGLTEWSSRNRVSISFAMALSWGSDVPEQITKKSVNVEMLRKSNTTMSSAFLFEASSAQVVANCSGVIAITPGKVSRVE